MFTIRRFTFCLSVVAAISLVEAGAVSAGWETGAFSMQPATFAMNSSGVITMGGMGMGGGMTNPMMVQTYSGFMNPGKDFMVATYSDGNGGYQLGIGMK